MSYQISDDGIPLPPLSEISTALLDLFGKGGISDLHIFFTEDGGDGCPVVWNVVGIWPHGLVEAEGALNPDDAIKRLAERVVDGAMCTHCGKPTLLILPEHDTPAGNKVDDDMMSLGYEACAYRYDGTDFVRSCLNA